MMNAPRMAPAAKPARTPTGRTAAAARRDTSCSPTGCPAGPDKVSGAAPLAPATPSAAPRGNWNPHNKQGPFRAQSAWNYGEHPVCVHRLYRAGLMRSGVDHIHQPRGSGEPRSGRDNDKINEHVILSGSSRRYFARRQCAASR